jgi:hypothetical protein
MNSKHRTAKFRNYITDIEKAKVRAEKETNLANVYERNNPRKSFSKAFTELSSEITKMRESSKEIKKQLKTFESTGRQAREKSVNKKHLPVNPLDPESSKRQLSKEVKKERIEKFIEHLPNKTINKMKKLEQLEGEIEEERD